MLVFGRILRFVAPAALILCIAALAGAQPVLIGPALQSSSPVEPGPAPASATPTEKHAQNAERLRLAQRQLEANGASDNTAAQEVAFYRTREAVLAQQDVVEQRIKDLESRKIELEAQLKSPQAIDKACTFAELDRMKDDLAADQSRDALVADKLTSAKANVDTAQSALDELLIKRRQAQAALENGKDGPRAAELAAAAKHVEQEAELAAELLSLRKREVDREQLTQDVLHLSVDIQKDQIARLSPLVLFSEQDYQEQIDNIAENEEAAANALAAAQEQLRSIEPQRIEAKEQLDAATDANRALLTEKYQALRRTKLRLSDEVNSQIQRQQQLAELRLAWARRYQIATDHRDSTDSDVFNQLKTQQKETKAVLNELASGLRTQIGWMGEVREVLTSVNKKAETAAKDPSEVLPWIQEQQQQLEEMQRIYERNLVSIEETRRVHEKLLDEINASLKKLTPTTIALGAWYQFKTVWDHPFHIGTQLITVGMAVQGLVTLAVGWVLSRFVSALVAYRLLKRFRLSKDATSAIKSLVFYSMLTAVVLQSLRTVNVDLTAFTIVGGALAIGVGFGSQALINNFIGGLIMLAERPVRLGERINFGGMDGIVEDVGFRCTKLRTNTDHLVTIPNSTLVNEKIENVDRRRRIRRKLNLPLTYNISRQALAAAVQAVRDILQEKDIRERIHPGIGFEEFLPRVFFNEFAAESLNIQVVYWYEPVNWWAYMEHAERVNYRIMEEFERLGIDFAFPSKTTYVKNQKKPGGIGREPGSFAA